MAAQWRPKVGFGLAALAATCLFLVEYLPPLARVQLHSDIDGFHQPLLGYAFQAVRAGRLPLWDPTIYCGLTYVGNPTAALFYPPTWLLFAFRGGFGALTYKSVEVFAFLHVWLAFLLAFGWLRETGGTRLASLLGAGVAAFGGYMLSQITHLGVATGYAWFPLALWGIEQARNTGSLRPFWMVSVASALTFLAGYPGTWVALAVCSVAYAAAGKRPLRHGAGTAIALAFSLAVAAVQVLPALDAARLKIPEPVYGGGLWTGARTYLTFFIPNFFDHSRPLEGVLPTDGEYFYWGAPASFALGWLLLRRQWRLALPGVAMAAACLLLILDPGHIAMKAMQAAWPPLRDAVREYSLLGGISIAAAFLTRAGIDGFLGRPAGGVIHRWEKWVAAAVVVLWCGRQLHIWVPGGREFAAGWAAIFEPAVTLGLFAALAGLARRDGRRPLTIAALLVMVFADYKVFGTNRRFNAAAGSRDRIFRDLGDARAGLDGMATMDAGVYRTIRRDPAYRVMFQDAESLHDTELRFYGLASPQGFDSLMPRAYRDRVPASARILTSRIFELNPEDEQSLQDFAVRYIICRNDLGTPAKLDRLPYLRHIGPRDTFLQTYEYLKARPAYRWSGDARVAEWAAERRAFHLRSSGGGTFALLEQAYPGWEASVDGHPAQIRTWDRVFQSVRVPPGWHDVLFEFRPRSFRIGAAVSLCAVLALLAFRTAALRRAG